MTARQLLTFNIDGPADIVGVVNGDNSSNELYNGNTRSLYNGLATVILRSKPESGAVKLTVSGLGFKKQLVSLQTK